MKQYEFIEDRLISGEGLLRLPQDPKYREFLVYIDIFRNPSTQYLNLTFVPPKGFYAHMQYMFNGYVLDSRDINFAQTFFKITPDLNKQTLIALKCIDEHMTNMLSLIGNSLNETQFTFFEVLKEFNSSPFTLDQLVFSCYTDTALKATLYGLEVQNCDPAEVDQPPPPPKPEPTDPVPPGVPITNITPPYDADDDFTIPNDIDDSEPPTFPPPELPVGVQCQRVLITSAITTISGGREERSEEVYGEVTEFFYNPSGGPAGNTKDAILVRSRGLVEFNGAVQPCGNPTTFVWQDAESDDFVSAEVISAEPIFDS